MPHLQLFIPCHDVSTRRIVGLCRLWSGAPPEFGIFLINCSKLNLATILNICWILEHNRETPKPGKQTLEAGPGPTEQMQERSAKSKFHS